MKPAVIFAGRTRYRLPLSQTLARKWDALGEVLDVRVVASSADGSSGDETFRLRPRTALDGPRFWLTLPWRLRREVAAARPAAIVAQSPFEAAAALVARTGVPVIVELHGDWRTFARLYGSPLRRVGARAVDAVGTWAVRDADEVRAVSPYTARLAREVGREPAAEFPAFMDLDPFLGPVRPLPEHRTRAVRRRPRAVQEHRRARRRMAARQAARRRCHASHRRNRVADEASSRSSFAMGSQPGASGSRPTRSRQHSTMPRSSCCPRGRRGWVASSSRPIYAAGR